MNSRVEPEPVPLAARPTVGAGATLASASQFVAAGASWLTGVVVARLLGASGAGDFGVVMTLFLTLSAFSNLGLQIGATYEVSHGRWQAGEALRQSQLAALVLGAASVLVGAAAVAAGGSSVFRGIGFSAFILALSGMPFALSWSFASNVLLAADRFLLYALGPALQGVAGVVLAAVFGSLFGLEGAVAGMTGSNLLAAAFVLALGGRSLPRPSPGWLRRSLEPLRRAVRFGIKSYFSNAVFFLNLRADLFILNAVAASAAVGRYAVAISITNLAGLAPRALSSVVLPRVASLDRGTSDVERDMVTTKSVRHGVIIVGVTAVVLVVVLLAVPLIYGSEFGGTVGLGMILIPGTCALGVAGILAATIVGRGHPEYSIYSALIVTPPAVVAYLLLVPPLEGLGAALASTISYLFTLAVSAHYFRKASGLRGTALFLPRRAELDDYVLLARRARRR